MKTPLVRSLTSEVCGISPIESDIAISRDYTNISGVPNSRIVGSRPKV